MDPRNGSADLIVNGGDVYDDGTPEEFEMFSQQMDGDLAGICETAGNHDWETRSTSSETGEIPSGYEAFWTRHRPHGARQPIDTSKRGGARYEHVIDPAGWRLLFLDTGPCKGNPWPMGDAARTRWLQDALTSTAGRAKVVFAHHSRLSKGKHGDIKDVDDLWRALFTAQGVPLAALTVAGHDHNVSLYKPRPQRNPDREAVPFDRGIHVLVNGAGGRGHDVAFRGTDPDQFSNDRDYCLTRLNLIDPRSLDVEILSFGPDKQPAPNVVPQLKHTLQIRV